MKFIALTLCALTLTCNAISQTVKDEPKKVETKMEAFSSKTGVISKFIDYNLPNLKPKMVAACETKIRKLVSGDKSMFFYQVVKKSQYGSTVGSIEYSDLLELIKALSVLKTEVDKDITANPDYLQNQFTTVDGVELGYYVSQGSANWYLQLEKYGSDKTLYLKDVESNETAMLKAKAKIEELKK